MTIRGQVQYHEPTSGNARILIDAGGVPGSRIDPEYRPVTATTTPARPGSGCSIGSKPVEPPPGSGALRDRQRMASARPPRRALSAGLVLPASVRDEDWIEVDIVFPDRRGQIRGLTWSPGHRWTYLDGMRPREAAIFTVYANAGVAGVAHAAVALVDLPEGARPRQSIESRAFVRFG